MASVSSSLVLFLPSFPFIASELTDTAAYRTDNDNVAAERHGSLRVTVVIVAKVLPFIFLTLSSSPMVQTCPTQKSLLMLLRLLLVPRMDDRRGADKTGAAKASVEARFDGAAELSAPRVGSLACREDCDGRKANDRSAWPKDLLEFSSFHSIFLRMKITPNKDRKSQQDDNHPRHCRLDHIQNDRPQDMPFQQLGQPNRVSPPLVSTTGPIRSFLDQRPVESMDKDTM